MSRTTLIVLAIVIAALFFFGGPEVVKLIKAGSVVGPKSNEDAAGVVRTDPEILLGETNLELQSQGRGVLNLDEYALARALRSEHGSSSAEVRTWVAWAIRNASAGPGNVFKKLTSSRAESSGLFARQISDSRYAATNQAPRVEDVEIARAVLRASTFQDPTQGATNFFSPRTQDRLFAKAEAGDPNYAGRIRTDAEGLRSKWEKGGLVSVGAPESAAADEVEFFAPKRFA